MAKKQTVNIHGKDYETVASRLNRFIEDTIKAGNKYCLSTTILGDPDKIDDRVAMKCIISVETSEGKPLNQASGHAFERVKSSRINQTSHLECCESSAIGRALAGLGYGGTDSIASADEVLNAIANQGQEEDVPSISTDEMTLRNMNLAEWKMPVGKYKDMTLSQIISQVTEGGKNKGFEYLEWFIEQKAKTKQGQESQDVVRFFLEDLKQGE